MATHLLIVESPAKAKTLKKYLGKDFEVLASYGHVRDLIPKTGAVDPENGFAMQYETIARNAKHVDAIAKAAADVDNILLAPDPDREGEAIAWHIAELLKRKRGLKGKNVQRVVFYEITQSAVKEAVAHPREISLPLVNAQQARRALDYLVGFTLSPLLWRKVRPGLSAGRVQSPALRLIVERELEIEKFKSQEYWSVHLDSQKLNIPFTAKLFQYQGKKLTQLDIANREQFEAIQAKLEHAKLAPKVVRVEKRAKQRFPAAPFTTSTLQQEAVRKLGMSADRAMRTAQSLYEGVDIGGQTVGLITYMRTDSVNLAKEAVAEIRDYVTENFAADFLPGKQPVYKSKTKNAQESHEAVRPTSILRAPDSLRDHLSFDQYKLYEMVWKRTLASQMAPARYDTVSADIRLGSDDNLFRASGQTLVFPGFIGVYLEDVDDAEEEEGGKLPPLAEGDVLTVDKLYGEQHFTQPPPRYSEASLVKALEEYGIGRPSTYAAIISTLQARAYATLDRKRFIPTDVGRVVNKFLTEHFSRYVDYGFTAQLEDELDEISEGKRDWIPVLDEFWKGFNALILEKQAVERNSVTQELLDEACPKCGKPLAKRLGKRGSFVGCTAFPACDFTRSLDDSESPDARQLLGTDPDSGKEIQLLRGPYGFYVQLGEADPASKTKPKRVSWPKDIPVESASLETGLQLLSLPRELGLHPESGKKVVVNIGRFGPYIGHDGKFKSIPKTDSIFTIELPRALELLAQHKAGNGVLSVVGNHPDDDAPVEICNGRYGPYVRHGKVNATLPKDMAPESVSLEQALAVLAERISKLGDSTKSPAKKKTPTRTAAKKPAAKKPAAKKKPRTTKS